MTRRSNTVSFPDITSKPERKTFLLKLTDEDLREMGLSRPSLEDGMDSPEAALRKMIRIQNMEKALNQHVYSVYQSTDGKWYTYFPQPEGGRKKVKRGSELAMKKKIIDHYMLSSQRAGCV